MLPHLQLPAYCLGRQPEVVQALGPWNHVGRAGGCSMLWVSEWHTFSLYGYGENESEDGRSVFPVSVQGTKDGRPVSRSLVEAAWRGDPRNTHWGSWSADPAPWRTGALQFTMTLVVDGMCSHWRLLPFDWRAFSLKMAWLSTAVAA